MINLYRVFGIICGAIIGICLCIILFFEITPCVYGGECSGDVYCRYCGTQLHEVCPDCDAVLKGDFCEYCGYEVTGDE